MKVFKREEIPDFYRIKNATYALDLLILPNINNVSLSTADNDHPYLYFPPLIGDESDAYQAKGKGHSKLFLSSPIECVAFERLELLRTEIHAVFFRI